MAFASKLRISKMGAMSCGPFLGFMCCSLLVCYGYYRYQTAPTPVLPSASPDSLHAGHYYSRTKVTSRTKNIIFVETSCAFSSKTPQPGGLVLNPRQACAVYSAAILNPHHQVYIFLTCPLHKDYYSRSSETVKKVLDLDNVGPVEIGWRAEEWFRGTPLEGFEAPLSGSEWRIEHSSDALRMLLLWKYGGTYLDLDVVILKNLEDLGENWGGAQDQTQVACGLVNFSAGHRLVAALLRRIAASFDPSGWISIGPSLLTSLLRSLCDLGDQVSEGLLTSCGFRVYPASEFYAVHYSIWQELFEPSSWANVSSSLEHAHAAHMWNKLSSTTAVRPGSPYARLAAANCPPIYHAAKENF